MADFSSADDAAVIRLDEKTALVQTVDFFTPIVDDPFIFGEIAAANSLSDIYAMGATPLFALNIVGFPKDDLPLTVLGEILNGGSDKAQEAGISILGGHSIDDKEPKYGLVVTGKISLDKIVTNGGAKPGDYLILTKPLGSGIISTAIKRGEATKSLIKAGSKLMTTLNSSAGKLMVKHGATAATDVTGFGLLGHLWEMCQASCVSVEINFDGLPFINGIYDLVKNNVVPNGTKRNLNNISDKVNFHKRLGKTEQLMVADSQTSGGLLIAMPKEKTESFLKDFEGKTPYKAHIIGKCVKPSTNEEILLL